MNLHKKLSLAVIANSGLRWQVKQRMTFIRSVIINQKRINRRDLMDQFGVSTPQASKDFQQFKELYPKVLEYDFKEKYYTLRKGLK